MSLLYLYRAPHGMVAAETQLSEAPLAGAFQHCGDTWLALGLARMVKRGHREAEVRLMPFALQRAAAERLESSHA